MLLAHILVLVALSPAGCVAWQEPLTVTQVWQDAKSLEGKRIRVRGQADFQLIPYHPLQIGGCIVTAEGEQRPRIIGELRLHDQDSHDPKNAILISESSLQCEGDVCSVGCKPFAPSAHATWGGAETVEAFEFVGTLRVRHQGNEVVLILDNIDLDQSRRLADGKWGAIPIEEITYAFP